MTEKRLCPLLSVVNPHDCQKDRCAWYNRNENLCAVLDIALCLEDIGSEGIVTTTCVNKGGVTP